MILARNPKFTDAQKRDIALLDPTGKAVDLISSIANTSKSTVYQAKREGRLLNKIEQMDFKNRELIVQNGILKAALKQNNKKSSGHS